MNFDLPVIIKSIWAYSRYIPEMFYKIEQK